MKKIISLLSLVLSTYAIGQTIDAQYLSPKVISTGVYEFVRFGTQSNYQAGFMNNISSSTYGNGNDFSVFTYNNRDLTMFTGTGNFIIFPSSGGNVGIGTTSPSEKLHVLSTANNTSAAIFQFKSSQSPASLGRGIQLYNTETSDNAITTIRFEANDPGGSARHMSQIVAGKEPGWAAGTQSTYKGYLSFWTRPGFQQEERLRISSDGNVGIGTTSPSEKLHVVSTNSNEIVWPVVANNPYNNSTTNEYGVGIKLKHSSNNETDKWSGIASVNEASWANNSGLALYSDGTEKVRIKHDGSVGIGTTQTFGYMLAVNGTIASKEVKVETTSAWPDFVFYNDYNLPSLEEVEKFIAQNNHLPEIPSEAEVLEDGINLGEMNAKLLQKIEELTLYLIEQNKRINTLEEKLAGKE